MQVSPARSWRGPGWWRQLRSPPTSRQVRSSTQVTCAADPTQSYAIFLPRAYTPDRDWPVILAFDPGGRGRTPVERYQAAADQYGFIVAGSNNSRNNSPEIGRAVAAMSADVLSRFRVDERRVYVAGMSGGARVAFSVALGSPDHVAGVIASSAGYPDDKPRKDVAVSRLCHRRHRRLQSPRAAPARSGADVARTAWRSSRAATCGCRATWRSRRSSGWSCRR
jgi:poly(3-hydroxybutyrate) depolymerase